MKSYFIYAIPGDNMKVAMKKQLIGLSKKSKLLKIIKEGDEVLFYQVGISKFVASGKVVKSHYLSKKIVWPDEKKAGDVLYPHRLNLKIKTFKYEVGIERVLYGLSFIKNKTKYGGYLRTSLVNISKRDYEKVLICSKSESKNFGTNLALGNSFQNRTEDVLRRLGFNVVNRKGKEGPDLVIEDREYGKKSRIIIQCKATAVRKPFISPRRIVDEYATKVKKERALLAIIFISNYTIPENFDVTLSSVKDRVVILTDDFLNYYEDLCGKIGSYAKYQFLADIGARVQFAENITTPALQVRQSGYTLYVAAIEAEWLLKSSAVLRRINGDKGVRYQRLLKASRVKEEIPAYLMEEWVLPNNLVLATKLNGIDYSGGKIRLPSVTGLFWVVDGQHRLYSFSNIPPERRKTKLLCAIFDSNEIGAEADVKLAKIFVDLNLYAKKVDSSLIIELSDIIGSKDPKLKIAFNLYKSPVFSGLVSSYSKKGGALNLTTLATNAAMKSLVSNKGPLINSDDMSVDQIVEICTKRLVKFFTDVSKIFEEYWGNRSYIISDNRGIRALFRLYLRVLREHGIQDIELNMRKVLKAIRNSDFDFSLDAAKNDYLGEGGADKLAKIWLSKAKLKLPGFSVGSDIQADRYTVPKEESETVEFKPSLRWDIDKKIRNDELKNEVIKGVSALMNTEGGSLFIGVSDRGEILGIKNDLDLLKDDVIQQKDEFRRNINSLIASKLGGVSTVDNNIHKVELREIENKFICQIIVKKSIKPIFFGNKFYRRLGASSLPLEAEELAYYLKKRF